MKRHGAKRTRRRSIALVVAVKVVVVVLVLALPSGVALSLGAAHGVALLLVAVAAVVLLVLARRPHGGGQGMLTAETTVQTTNASRYLVQLCKHATKVGHGHTRMSHARPEVLDVDWSDTHGTLVLSWGQCTLDADPTTLTVRAEADSEENLRRVQNLVTANLERFGQREQVTVTWQQVHVR